MRDDLQTAAAELQFVESAAGYAQLRAPLEQIAVRQGNVHFYGRLDAAGQYAGNFLHGLAASSYRAAKGVDQRFIDAIMGHQTEAQRRRLQGRRRMENLDPLRPRRTPAHTLFAKGIAFGIKKHIVISNKISRTTKRTASVIWRRLAEE